jgi:hypothetical protein
MRFRGEVEKSRSQSQGRELKNAADALRFVLTIVIMIVAVNTYYFDCVRSCNELLRKNRMAVGCSFDPQLQAPRNTPYYGVPEVTSKEGFEC